MNGEEEKPPTNPPSSSEYSVGERKILEKSAVCQRFPLLLNGLVSMRTFKRYG
jgi:hypothetical protein